MDCLDENTVAALISGGLASDLLASAEEHLASCPRCCEDVAAVAGSDSRRTLTKAPSESADAVLEPGALIAARYRVERYIASGGMGDVYQVEDTLVGGRLALKALRRELVNEETTGRLRRELQLTRRVRHASVCRVFDHGVHRRADGELVPFLTMELIEGETLATRLKGNARLSPAEALPLVAQLTAGLDAAHDAGVIHRDFKPANIMLERQADGTERAVITDFGLARAQLSGDTLSITSSGAVLGTPAFMAPEQALGTRVGPAADRFALGVVLYRMITGQLPYGGTTAVSTVFQRLKGPPARPSQLVPQLERAWDEAILWCLEIEPARRPPSAGQVLLALTGRGAQKRRWRPLALAIAIAVIALAAGLALARNAARTPAASATTRAAELRAAALREERLVDLTTLPRTKTVVGDDGRLNVNRKLVVAGQPFARGFMAHADSTLAFDLPAGADTFIAHVGVEDSGSRCYEPEAGTPGDGARFAVELDGRPVWQSATMRPGALVEVEVALGGARHLVLRTLSLVNDYCDQTVWAEPALLLSRAPPPDPSGALDLTRLAPLSARVGYGALVVNQSDYGAPLVLGGRPFAKGFWAHAASSLLFSLDGSARIFTAEVGLALSGREDADGFCLSPEGVARSDGVEFSVVVDGKEAWHSQALRLGDAPLAVSVPVSGARSLELRAAQRENNNCDHAVWVDPALRQSLR